MTLQEMLRHQPVTWHGVRLNAPDWGHDSHTLAATTRLLGGQAQLHLIVNAYWEALEFEIPPPATAHLSWRRIIDTSLDSPDDVCAWADAPAVQESTYVVQPRSVVLLVATAASDDIPRTRPPGDDAARAPERTDHDHTRPSPTRRWPSSPSTPFGRCRWTRSRRRIRGTRERRWRSRRWSTRSGIASCASTRRTRSGPAATASCSRTATPRCCSGRCST